MDEIDDEFKKYHRWDYSLPDKDFSKTPIGYDEDAILDIAWPALYAGEDPQVWIEKDTWSLHEAASLFVGISPDLWRTSYFISDFGPSMEDRFFATMLKIVDAQPDDWDPQGGRIKPNELIDQAVRHGWGICPRLLKLHFQSVSANYSDTSARGSNEDREQRDTSVNLEALLKRALADKARAESSKATAENKSNEIILGLTAALHLRRLNESLNIEVVASGKATKAPTIAHDAIAETLGKNIDVDTIRKRLISAAEAHLK